MAISIRPIFERRKIALEALSAEYAERALQMFRDKQPLGTAGTEGVWNNQTGQAAAAVFSDTFSDGDDIGFLLAHGMDYGKWLELANNRKYEVLRPIIESLAASFLDDVKRIYAG